MKKMILLIMSMIILVSFASAFEVQIYDSDKEESYLFAPGSFMKIEADVDSAKISLVYNKQIQIFSEDMIKEKGKVSYGYNIPSDMKKGNYDIIVLTEDEKQEKEIIIGNVIKMNFVEPTKEVKEKIEKIKLEVDLEKNDPEIDGENEITVKTKDNESLIGKMLNNIWVNYIWIKE